VTRKSQGEQWPPLAPPSGRPCGYICLKGLLRGSGTCFHGSHNGKMFSSLRNALTAFSGNVRSGVHVHIRYRISSAFVYAANTKRYSARSSTTVSDSMEKLLTINQTYGVSARSNKYSVGKSRAESPKTVLHRRRYLRYRGLVTVLCADFITSSLGHAYCTCSAYAGLHYDERS
jgi:hypothetical protein